MLRIGITGGIGSGKSYVAKLFQYFGIPVYDADENAKRLMRSSSQLVALIKESFGTDCYLSDGTLNKPYLRTIVFTNSKSREQMNALVHPAVAEDFLHWSSKQKTPFVLFESALIYQSVSIKNLHYIFAVSADDNIRINRFKKRDSIDEATAHTRLAAQLPQETICEKANEIIQNDNKELLIPQVLQLIKKYGNGEI